MLKDIIVPDLGNFSQVPVIELLVKVGDQVEQDASLLTLETDKATLEVPSSHAGVVKEILVKLNDKVSQGDKIMRLEMAGEAIEEKPEKPEAPVSKQPEITKILPEQKANDNNSNNSHSLVNRASEIYAGPGVRRMVREMGLELNQIPGTGKKGRISNLDVHAYVKTKLSN
ncbi:MAG: biotin/lipoyl-containing protein, partial [Gammaproteobacteria bacterium]